MNLDYRFEILFSDLAARAFPIRRKLVERSSGVDALAWIALFRVVDVTADSAAVLRHVCFVVKHGYQKFSLWISKNA